MTSDRPRAIRLALGAGGSLSLFLFCIAANIEGMQIRCICRRSEDWPVYMAGCWHGVGATCIVALGDVAGGSLPDSLPDVEKGFCGIARSISWTSAGLLCSICSCWPRVNRPLIGFVCADGAPPSADIEEQGCVWKLGQLCWLLICAEAGGGAVEVLQLPIAFCSWNLGCNKGVKTLFAAVSGCETSDGYVPISGVESNSQIGAAPGLGLEALPQVDHSASTSDDSLPPLDLKACSPNALMPDSVHPSTSVLHEDCGPQLAEPPIDPEALSGQCSSLLNDADPQLPELDIVWPVIQDPIPSQLGLAIFSSFPVNNGPHSCLLDTSGDLAVELVEPFSLANFRRWVWIDSGSGCCDGSTSRWYCCGMYDLAVENSTSIGCSCNGIGYVESADFFDIPSSVPFGVQLVAGPALITCLICTYDAVLADMGINDSGDAFRVNSCRLLGAEMAVGSPGGMMRAFADVV
ncbi:hypothetical protein Nepgr_023059 [Nepenthes gracilis]|uniref:Uncharacterized protein n=1 Tax=Nepenthes gracilis TaxID=150966 RepID=A0AAD3T1Y3_NEPGR|nr:hypothetical protein Nepgr_023059 [Nepenthes gracilis]